MADGLETTLLLRHRWHGTSQAILDALTGAGYRDQTTERTIGTFLSVESTIVRARQHAAGARKDSAGTQAPTPTVRVSAPAQGLEHAGTGPTPTGRVLNDKKPAPVEPDDHALGRSRGGLSTKVNVLADTNLKLVGFILTGGQAGENPQLVGMVDEWRSTHSR